MGFSPLIDKLITTLRRLPGVGTKSAQRMAFHLLERDRNGGSDLAKSLLDAMEKVGHCERCRTFCESPLCRFCSNPARDRSLLCVVETPADVLAIEQAASFRGLYFVLMGHLSPLDGIGPEDIGIHDFEKLLDSQEVKEVILATNPTVEGEATAHYLAEMIKKRQVRVSRIAHGVPFGGELEFIDSGTLSRALVERDVI